MALRREQLSPEKWENGPHTERRGLWILLPLPARSIGWGPWAQAASRVPGMSQVKGAPEDERLSLRCSSGDGRNGEVRRNAPLPPLPHPHPRECALGGNS